ncbi:MAG: dipeptidyl aminopeptidase/acylaminoacyl peptidase [Flavobacteriales bacterium]|jgi:dipeptidyl aminopeptidase/acylaminoacyl peptidase
MFYMKKRTLIFQLLLIFNLVSFVSVANIIPAQLAKNYEYLDAKISPNGKHLALTIVKDGSAKLAVVTTNDFRPVGGADFGRRQSVGEVFWATDKRLVIKVLVDEPWRDQDVYRGELYAVNIDGKSGELIYGYRSVDTQAGTRLSKKEAIVGWAEIISLLPDDDKHILISSTPFTTGRASKATIHKLNVFSGELSGRITGAPAFDMDFFADAKGNLISAVGLDSLYQTHAYLYEPKTRTWTNIKKADWVFGNAFSTVAIDEKKESLYYLDNLNQDTSGLFKMNLKTGKRESIYTNDNVSITNVSRTTDLSSVYAVRVDDGYPQYMMLDAEKKEATLFAKFTQSFAGYSIYITSHSDDQRYWVISAKSDVVPTSFYLYDAKKNQYSLLFANLPELDKNKLSSSIPIKFEASDGAVLSAYITYPTGVDETVAVPLVTLVHGGPNARDYWKFDPELQLLASQGYAVLRVNYRGSTGYGRKHMSGSEKQWGARVQQDIIEATQWVIQQGGIQQDKVCIMGGSFGGYSAVQSATLAPDLFKCVVAVAGVYDLEMMFDEGDIPRIIYGKEFLIKQLGTDRALMRKYSPVHNVHKLKASLLIAHGKKDERVPIAHAFALKEELNKQGKKYDWFVKDAEGHGFFDEQNRTEYFEKVVEFLAKELK